MKNKKRKNWGFMTKMFNNKISYNKNKSIEDIIIITINITINPRMHI